MVIAESIKISYQELFTVTLAHPAFELNYPGVSISSIINSLTVEPDTATQQLFADHSMGYRYTNNTIICFIRTQPGPLAYIPLPDNAVIRLLLRPKAEFLSRTDVLLVGSSQVYWFSNSNITLSGGLKYITRDATGAGNSDLVDIATLTLKENCWGVIDVLASVTDSDYRIFDSGVLKRPAFNILFKQKTS